MNKVKKILALVLSAIMLLSCGIMANAATLNEDNPTGNTTVEYTFGGASGTFTVTIPDYIIPVDIDETRNAYTVSAEDVYIPVGTYLSVYCSFDGRVVLEDNSSTVLPYKMYKADETTDGIEVLSGDHILVVYAGNVDGDSNIITAELTEAPKYAGKYFDTAVFSIVVHEEYDNTFLLSHAVSGKIYKPNTGTLGNNAAMVSFSPFDVEGYDKIAIQNNQSVDYPRVIVFWDENMNVIAEYSTLASENQPYPEETFRSVKNSNVNVSMCDINIPASTKYCGFTVRDNRVEEMKVYLSKGSGFWPLPIETHGYFETFENSTTSLPEIKSVSSAWSGKKMIAIGDSITSGYNLTGTEMPWSAQTASMLNMDFVNYGIGGSEIAQFVEGNDSYNPMSIRYADMDDDADLVLVAGGTNDWSHNHTELGTIEDTSVNTLYGALNTLCSGLKAKYPNAKIIFMTPIKRFPGGYIYDYNTVNDYGFDLNKTCDVIKEVCEKYDITVLDMFTISNLDPTNAENQAKYFTDGSHPNYLGATDMAQDVVDFLKTVKVD